LLTLENVASSVQYRVAGVVTDGVKEAELKTVVGVTDGGPIDNVICLLAGDEAVVILPR
jgi:hypothetical protein